MGSKFARMVLPAAAGALCLLAAACGSEPAAKSPAPSTAELLAHESELLKLTLSPQAVRQLGIRTYAVRAGAIAGRLSLHGEVVVASLGGAAGVGAPADLATLAASQARVDGSVARARVEVAAAARAAQRARALVAEEAGSERAREEAEAALGVAQAGLRAAQAERAAMGPPVASIGRQGALWVRVPVLAGDLPAIERSSAARVAPLGGEGPGSLARPVQGPPSSNAAAGTVDLYYALPGARASLRVGQRVAVELPATGGVDRGILIPTAAVLTDIYGGEWVYVAAGQREYRRKRIEVAGVENGMALVARGLAAGDSVVTDGAAELFGTEFGAK
jgi:hypothetical protein